MGKGPGSFLEVGECEGARSTGCREGSTGSTATRRNVPRKCGTPQLQMYRQYAITTGERLPLPPSALLAAPEAGLMLVRAGAGSPHCLDELDCQSSR